MPYIVNGKTYTSYPLLDEIVYNCKLILNGIVVKNEYVAHLYETEESLYNQEILFKCKMGTMSFFSMPFSADMLLAYGYDASVVNQYVADPSLIPEDDRESVLAFCIQYYIDNFVEINKYYRSLMGLPEYGTDRYNVYITANDLPDDFDLSLVDFDKPLHEQTSVVISALRSNGRMNEIIAENRSFNYSYLRFLDDLSLDIYTCRRASKWDILYMPDANEAVVSRFEEVYNINKQIYLRRTYQNAYAFRSDYYDHMLIFIVICQTFADLVDDTPEWFIRKDIFDIRTVQFFLEAYGIPFFEEIPLKYQIRIVKNLNKLIEYKSTQQNFEDIIDIFRLREVNIYRYYLYKKRRRDSSGHYIDDPDLEKMYELLFVEVMLGDTYDNYIKNLNYRTPYDEITMVDEYWDGTDDHDYVKQQVLQKEFTIEPTKYLTIKADVDYISYQKQLRYLLGLILDSRIDTDDVTIGVPSIYEGVSFKLSDLFLFIELLNNLEMDIRQDIIRPEDVHEEGLYPIPDYDPDSIPYEQKLTDWWLRENYPEFFKTSKNRVFGFNPNVNWDEIQEVLGRGYTNFGFKDYNLEDFGCENYIVVNTDINSCEQMLDIYENNMACYEKLNDIICHSCDNEFEQLTAKYLYNELFTKEFDYGFGGEKNTLDEVLQERDYILWSFYKNLSRATDKDSRNKDIASILNEITLSLEYYFDRDSLDYFFSFISTSNFAAISRYIYLMLNAFKSYKAHFLYPTVRYRFLVPDMVAGNYTEMNDTIMYSVASFSKFDKEYIHDYMNRMILRYFTDDERSRYVEILDIFKKFDPDPEDDYDYDGGYPDTDESLYFKTIDGTEPEMMVPYKTTDGGFPYGRHGVVAYQADGKDEVIDLTSEKILELDGGNIMDDDYSFLNSPNNYFQKAFNKDFNGGSPFTDYIVNNNFFKRVYDFQTNQDMLISARTGYKYSEDLINDDAYLKEIWREWLSVTEFESVKGDIDLFEELIVDNEFTAYYAAFMEEFDEGKVRVFTDELHQRNNHGLDLSISKVNAEDNKRVRWIWDFGDLDDPLSGNPDLNVSNYEDREIVDYDFNDIDEPGSEIVLHHDYNFGDTDLSRIIWIEDIYNYDTSRIITYKL